MKVNSSSISSPHPNRTTQSEPEAVDGQSTTEVSGPESVQQVERVAPSADLKSTDDIEAIKRVLGEKSGSAAQLNERDKAKGTNVPFSAASFANMLPSDAPEQGMREIKRFRKPIDRELKVREGEPRTPITGDIEVKIPSDHFKS